MIEFTIDGKPKGKDRPRFYKGHAYTPRETKVYEGVVRWAYHDAGGSRFTGAVSVLVDAYFAPPKSTPKAKRRAMLIHEERPIKKPDADNIAKIIMDALNGLAYADDTQVVEVICRKWYGETDHVTVKIFEE